MPDLQIINRPPSFGENLGQNLGAGLSQGINQFFERKQNQQKISDLMQSLGIPTSETSQAMNSLNSQQSPQNQRGQGFGLTPQKILTAHQIDPSLAGPLSTLYQTQERASEKRIEREASRSGKFLDTVTESSRGIPERRTSINAAKQAVQSGQLAPLGGDFWADVLNAPQLKSASGAQLATAAKTNLIGSLGRITGGRPNQFIEQQINNAFAKAGQSKEANTAQLDILESILDMDEKYNETAFQLADQYEKELGYVPASIDRDTQKFLKPYIEQRQEKLAYDLQQNIESEQGPGKRNEIKKVSKGTPLTLRKAKVLVDKYGDKAEEVAKKLGYEIPSSEIYSGEE